MRFALILLVVLACVALTLASCDRKCKAKKVKRKQEAALKAACKEIGGGTKVRLEIDLGAGCFGKCRNKKAKKASSGKGKGNKGKGPRGNNGNGPSKDKPAHPETPSNSNANANANTNPDINKASPALK